MVTNNDLYKKYGDPGKKKFVNEWLVMYDVPTDLEIGVIPKRIYCNKDLIAPISQGFRNLIVRGYVGLLKTWDGCYNHRPVRGYEKQYAAAIARGDYATAMKYLSNHSWATAFDINASENGLGKKPKLPKEFVKCFTDAGFDWGGSFSRPDGMHFQLASLP